MNTLQNTPYISIIIPTYNRYSVLKRAIQSIKNQTYTNYEIIIIDDGSSDETYNIKDEFSNVRYFYKQNGGVSSARNFGIKEARYEWIAFLDSDDEWSVEKLFLQVLFHNENPNIFISYTDEKWIRDGKVINLPKKFRKYDGDIFNKLLSHTFIAPSATMINKKLFDKVGLFDEDLEVCEDYDLYLRIAIDNKIGLIDKKLTIKYGGENDQLSSKFWGMDRFRVVALEKLLTIDKEKDKVIAMMLVKKYTLLLKGAIKYDRITQEKEYKKKILYFREHYGV